MDVKVLGSGCANCRNTASLIEQVAGQLGIDVTIEKVEDVREIMRYNVLATPAVVVDGVVVHAGGVPSRERVGQWLGSLAAASPCCSNPTTRCCG